MEKYNWDEESIRNSENLNEITKELLLAEIHKEKDIITSKDNEQTSIDKFKEKYNFEYENLYQFSKEMLDYIINLYKTSNTITPTLQASADIMVTPEFIINVMQEFIINTEDYEIINTFASILNSNKNYIRIYPREKENKAIENFKGRCILPNDSKDTYISIYQTGYMNDLALAAHEFGHAIEHRLFFDNKNPLIQNYLTEVSSYFFELLMSSYIMSKMDFPLAGLMLEGTRTNKTIDSIWSIKIQSELNKQNDFNPDEINKILSSLNRTSGYNKEQLQYIANTGLYYNSKLINSYMIANKLYYIYLQDPTYAIHIYKELMQSNEINLLNLLDEYNINYLKDNNEFTLMQKKANAVRKIISR